MVYTFRLNFAQVEFPPVCASCLCATHDKISTPPHNWEEFSGDAFSEAPMPEVQIPYCQACVAGRQRVARRQELFVFVYFVLFVVGFYKWILNPNGLTVSHAGTEIVNRALEFIAVGCLIWFVGQAYFKRRIRKFGMVQWIMEAEDVCTFQFDNVMFGEAAIEHNLGNPT